MADEGGLRVVAVEDEALLLMKLEALLRAAGHTIAASAMSGAEVIDADTAIEADVAFVDLHLCDGDTGLAVGRYLARVAHIPVVYVTASERRIPALAGGASPGGEFGANDAGGDYGHAVAVIAKPYTTRSIEQALDYLAGGLRDSSPRGLKPPSLFITPAYAARWNIRV